MADDAIPQGWTVDYPTIAASAAQQAGIPPDLFQAQINQESSFNPLAKNGNATGIAQFMPATANEQGIDPTDPVASLYAAAQYMANLRDTHGSYEDALKHYGTVDKAGPANQGQANVLALAQGYDKNGYQPQQAAPQQADASALPDGWSYDQGQTTDQPAPTKTSTLGAFGAGVGNGATLGFGPRILAEANSLIGNGDYEGNKAKYNQYIADAKNEHPVAYTGGDIAGNVATGLLAPEAELGSIGKWALMGGAEGLASTPDLSNSKEAVANALMGGALGAGTAGALQGAGALLHGLGTVPEGATNYALKKADTLVGHLIPHTKGVLDKGASAGDTLAEYVQNLARKNGNTDIADKIGKWYADPANSNAVKQNLGRAALGLASGGHSLAAEAGARAAGAAVKGAGNVTSAFGKYVGDPGGLLTALQGTRYYQPMLNAMTNSKAAASGLSYQLLNQDPQYRNLIGYADEDEE